jgi:hypothetical protein
MLINKQLSEYVRRRQYCKFGLGWAGLDWNQRDAWYDRLFNSTFVFSNVRILSLQFNVRSLIAADNQSQIHAQWIASFKALSDLQITWTYYCDHLWDYNHE